MVRFALSVILIMVGISSAYAERSYFGVDLEALEGKKRVILLFTPTVENTQFTEQLSLINRTPSKNLDRDLILFTLTQHNKNHRHLFDKFNVSNKVTLILLGKDGGEKLRKNSLTPPEELYRLIDSMPMRQSEIRNKKAR